MLIQSAIFRADNVFPSKLPLLWGIWTPIIHGSLDSPESTLQTASRKVQLFLQSSRLRPTNTPRYSDCNNSSEMRSNNKLCNIVVTDGTNQ